MVAALPTAAAAAVSRAALLRHPGVRLIGGGWAFFIAENVVVSNNRDAIIASIGEVNYRRVYSGLSTCACASIVVGHNGFACAHVGRRWRPGESRPVAPPDRQG